MSLSMRAATRADAPLLARMNKHLFEDAGSQNPMSVTQLQQRMEAWLAAKEWTIILLINDDTVIGYAIFNARPDSYQPEVAYVYIRQYFIERDWRRKGLGREAFAALARSHFPSRSKVVIDALATDPTATAFWTAIGFQPYSVTMMLHYHGDYDEGGD